MTKEQLREMGLTDEQAEQVIRGLDGNFVTKDRFNQVNTELKQARETLKERDGQLETLKTGAGAVDALKQQIETLQADNKAKEERHAAELKALRLEAAVEKALLGANARNTKAVRALLSLEEAQIDDDGQVKGLEAQIKMLREAEDTKFLFRQEEAPKLEGFQPGERKDGAPTRAPKKMGYAELCAYLAQGGTLEQ